MGLEGGFARCNNGRGIDLQWTDDRYYLLVPFWTVCVAELLMPATWLVYHQRSRPKIGHCIDAAMTSEPLRAMPRMRNSDSGKSGDMKGLRRWMFHATAATSSMLFIAVGLIWFHAITHYDRISFRYDSGQQTVWYDITTSPHVLQLSVSTTGLILARIVAVHSPRGWLWPSQHWLIESLLLDGMAIS